MFALQKGVLCAGWRKDVIVYKRVSLSKGRFGGALPRLGGYGVSMYDRITIDTTTAHFLFSSCAEDLFPM